MKISGLAVLLPPLAPISDGVLEEREFPSKSKDTVFEIVKSPFCSAGLLAFNLMLTELAVPVAFTKNGELAVALL